MSQINDIQITEPQNFTTVTGNNDDVSLASSQLWVTCTDNNDKITGMVTPISLDGMECIIMNKSASNILIIPNNDAGSTDGYRFILGGGSTSLSLSAGQGQLFILTSSVGWAPLRVGTFS